LVLPVRCTWDDWRCRCLAPHAYSARIFRTHTPHAYSARILRTHILRTHILRTHSPHAVSTWMCIHAHARDVHTCACASVCTSPPYHLASPNPPLFRWCSPAYHLPGGLLAPLECTIGMHHWIAGHFSEVAFVFGNCGGCGEAFPEDCCQGLNVSSAEPTVSAFAHYWGNLARYGNPNGRVTTTQTGSVAGHGDSWGRGGGAAGLSLPVWPTFGHAVGGWMLRFGDIGVYVEQDSRSSFCTLWDKGSL
jgi:hypothetical protein